MNNSIKFYISKSYNCERLDKYLSKKLENFTRSNIKKIIEKKGVKINEYIVVTPSTKVKTNDLVCIKILRNEGSKLMPKKINLDIIYEDKDLLVINKPKGMVVHPGAGNYANTLANALAYKYKKNLSDINGVLRPGIVHRIDKETSGLLLIAKNNLVHSKLSEQFTNHSISRKYKCLVWGVIRPLNGRIETLITRSKKNRQLMAVSDLKGKNAITNYKTVKVFIIKDIPKISLVECELETGRTHQIRVHLKYKGSSILGDMQYGKKNQRFKKINKVFLENLKMMNGQALHAYTIEFFHPIKKKRLSFKADIPEDFKKMLNLLKNLNG
jgi:23S rRNA pseudouridine1911/1915/1917 synthase